MQTQSQSAAPQTTSDDDPELEIADWIDEQVQQLAQSGGSSRSMTLK